MKRFNLGGHVKPFMVKGFNFDSFSHKKNLHFMPVFLAVTSPLSEISTIDVS